MDELLKKLGEIPEITFDMPRLLIQFAGEGISLGELDEGLEEVQGAIERVVKHYSNSASICRKLAALPPRTIADGIPIGF